MQSKLLMNNTLRNANLSVQTQNEVLELDIELASTSMPPIILLEHHLHSLQHIDVHSTGLCCVCICICVRVCVYVSACVDACCVCLRACVSVCVRAYVYKCVCVCSCVRTMRVCTSVWCVVYMCVCTCVF